MMNNGSRRHREGGQRCRCGLMAGNSHAAIVLPLLLCVLLSLNGCGRKQAGAPPPIEQRQNSDMLRNADPTAGQRVRLSSDAPVVLFARTGQRPGEVLVVLLNQTNREFPVEPEMFALILGPRRSDLRIFTADTDDAYMPVRTLAPESQQSFMLRFALPPQTALAGRRLVLNLEPVGLPPTFAEIEERPAGNTSQVEITE